MNRPAGTATTDARPGHRRARTWCLFTVLTALMLAANWYFREFVMTREVQELVLGDRMDAVALERRWQLYERTAFWSYVLTPVLLWVQVAFVALAAQLGLLLWRIEIPFSRLFRATLVAQVVPVAEALVALVRQARLIRTESPLATLYDEAGALADLAPRGWAGAGPLGAALETVTLFDLGWYTLLFLAYRRIARVGRRAAGLVVLALGVVFNFFEWAINAYVARLGG